jgi:hypothetical protein
MYACCLAERAAKVAEQQERERAALQQALGIPRAGTPSRGSDTTSTQKLAHKPAGLQARRAVQNPARVPLVLLTSF